jgi:hypothetical protein
MHKIIRVATALFNVTAFSPGADQECSGKCIVHDVPAEVNRWMRRSLPPFPAIGLDKNAIMPYKIAYHAEVVELVDTPVSGTGGHYARGGSSPPFGMFPHFRGIPGWPLHPGTTCKAKHRP